MNKKEIDNQISFDDSEFLSFDFSFRSHLIINLRSWEEKTIQITFDNPIYFLYQLGALGGKLYEIDDPLLLNKALTRKFTEIPTSHDYKVYQIEDIDDLPYIQVVARLVEIKKLEN